MNKIKVTQAKVEKQITNSNFRMKYERDEFNSIQNKLYKEVLFGLSNFSESEIKAIPYKEQNRINKTHRHAQSILNIWKQELCNNIVNDLFKALFPKSSITKELNEEYGNLIDPTFKNFVNFKDLGISKKQIVNKLITHNVLPKNFFELNESK
mgnify:CR=1 FL=1